MSFSAGSLREILETLTPPAATGYVVAISGGGDSACLLTALAPPLATPCRGLPLRAVHVDHGLQPAAADLRRACQTLCARLGVPLTVVPVAVDAGHGASIEAAAREARYRGIAAQFAPGECLLTAHHAEDQAETLLLQLMRGAGLKGMSAMPASRAWAGGWHLRPLLKVAQRDLRHFAATAGITEGIADPMNRDPRFDRVYLREEVWPRIERRWPGAAIALGRAARHAADAQELLDRSAARAMRVLLDGDTLSVTGLRALAAPERLNVLRHWIAARDLPLPSAARLGEAVRQIMSAQADHLPAIVWGEHALRRYRDRVFLTAARPPRIGAARDWALDGAAAVQLGSGLGSLHWSSRSGGLDAARLREGIVVRQRQGGESLKPQRHGRTRTLQHLCQSLGVLPWMRDALPLLYAGNALIGVGDLWQDVRWCVAPEENGVACDWRNAPVLV